MPNTLFVKAYKCVYEFERERDAEREREKD